MSAAEGAALKSALGAANNATIDVAHLGSLKITSAAGATARNFTALQVTGTADLVITVVCKGLLQDTGTPSAHVHFFCVVTRQPAVGLLRHAA